MPWSWGSGLRVGQQVEYSAPSSGYGKGYEEVEVGTIRRIDPQPSLVTIDTGKGVVAVPATQVQLMKGGARKTLSKRRHNKRTKRTKATKRSNLKKQ